MLPQSKKELAKIRNLLWIILVAAFISSCSRAVNKDVMNLTAHSDKALDLYNQAYANAFRILELDKAVALYEKAIAEDPDFFMAYYQLATYHLFHGNDREFENNARAAIQISSRLSSGERIQKKVLEKWLADQESNVSNLGQQLVQMFPNDPDAYMNLGYYEYMAEQYPEAIEAFERAESLGLKKSAYCGPKLAIVPLCMLGYTYLNTGQVDKARESFDRYIQRYPDDQNPYDCKADYFIYIGDYKSAAASYLKAYQMDTTHSEFLERALEAGKLAGSESNIE